MADGKTVKACWYKGNDDEFPYINVNWPDNFCGAVDFGMSDFGRVILIGNNLPYGCRWFGGYENGDYFIEWVVKGWEYMIKEYGN